MPLGMVHQLMFISQFDLEENRSYNYLRWSSTHDHYSLNFILSISPKRADYNIPKEDLFDLEENHSYNYLRWSITYDHYSLNFILSISPKRADYNLPEENLPRSLAGFGTGLQFMFIYNH